MSAEIKIDKQKDYDIDIDTFRRQMLEWYQVNARSMPWRAPFGQFPNPYHEWLSEIMLQQTVVKAVIPYFLRFIEKWPRVEDLANAEQEDVMKEWAGLGYYARARNLHKCAKIVTEEYGGKFPDNEKELLKLPGIGPYTAAAIAAIAFNKPTTVMDGNVERVLARLFSVQKPLKEVKKELYAYAHYLSQERTDFPGDYAQSMMELGATVCTPTSPKCFLCPVRGFCEAYQSGIQDSLPVKASKQIKPTRYGIVFFILDGGKLLFEKRPDKGLLGGLIGLPGTEWIENKDQLNQGLDLYKDCLKVEKFLVKHSFTHFHLELEGYTIDKQPKQFTDTGRYFWHNPIKYDKLALSSLYKKVMKNFQLLES